MFTVNDIIYALLFGVVFAALYALVRAIRNRLKGKKVTELRMGSEALLVGLIIGGFLWLPKVIEVIHSIINVVRLGWPTPIEPGSFSWYQILYMSVIFIGLVGWVLVLFGWRMTRRGESGLKLGVAGGVLMALTSIMLFPGVLAIIGGVFKGRKPANELSTAANVGKLNCYMPRVSIFLITVAFLIMVALIAGMVVGSGPPSQNLAIRTWYDLDAVRDNLRGHHILMNDLDATTAGYTELASPTANQGKGWQSIGTLIPQQGFDHGFIGFEGTFDGQGYEIRDLFINRTDEVAVGLFGAVEEGGVIENAAVVNADVTGNISVGGLIGFNMKGTVSDSYSTSSVTGNSSVGGLAGWNLGPVSNSYSTGSVSGNWSVGGLVGWNFDTVSNSYSSANVTGTSGVGGLVGSGAGTVSNCYATSSVSGDSSVGGLMGDNGGTVLNSYSTGSVTGNYTVGGLMGDTFEGTVSDSYSTASVTGNSSVGGLVGENERSTVSNSFWDTQTSGQATSAGGTGKTTAEMQDIATFSGADWNIIAVALNQTKPAYIWNIVDHETYPFLSWQS